MKEVSVVEAKVENKEYVRPEEFVCLSQATQLYQKLVRDLNKFIDDHKLFKEKFIFNSED